MVWGRNEKVSADTAGGEVRGTYWDAGAERRASAGLAAAAAPRHVYSSSSSSSSSLDSGSGIVAK